MESRTDEARLRKILWARDLASRWGVSLPTIWRWRRRGAIPAPDFQGTGWRIAVIEALERGDLDVTPRGPSDRPARHK